MKRKERLPISIILLPATPNLRVNILMSKRHWRCISAILLTVAMLLTLVGCGQKMQAEADPEKLSTLPETYLSIHTDSSFPLGLNSCIQGIVASENSVFVGGMWNELPILVQMKYSRATGKVELGEPELLELPEFLDGTQLMGLSYATDRLCLLLEIPEEDRTSLSYQVLIYNEDGSFDKRIELDCGECESPLSILALDDGSFCIWGINQMRLYSLEGELIEAFEREREEFYPPLLLNDELVIWLRDPETGRSTLNIMKAEKDSLEPLAEFGDIGAPTAYTQSLVGYALVSTESGLHRINSDYSWETIFEWYPLTGNYGQDYRYICQLEDNVFLTAAKNSSELKQLTLSQHNEERPLVRLGFYGLSEYVVEDLTLLLTQYNPEYQVETIDWGRDEASLSKLLTELAAGDKLDILVTGCDTVPPSDIFMDLYQLLDQDEELSREDLLPQILSGLETGGELRQIWNSFAISAPMALGPLTEGPSPLRLVDCPSYLDSLGYDGVLFDAPMTREDLFNIVADGLLADSYQEETGEYSLDRSRIREIVELCNTLPAEEVPLDKLTDQGMSLVLQTTGPTLAGLMEMEEEQRQYRFFDGSDGGDNFVRLMSAYGTCFMIPESCEETENAWGFLRVLLLPETQLKFYEDKGFYPSNAQAFESLLASCGDSQVDEAVSTLLSSGHIRNYDAAQRREILFSCLEPCIYGDYDINLAIENAQGRLNLYSAE